MPLGMKTRELSLKASSGRVADRNKASSSAKVHDPSHPAACQAAYGRPSGPRADDFTRADAAAKSNAPGGDAAEGLNNDQVRGLRQEGRGHTQRPVNPRMSPRPEAKSPHGVAMPDKAQKCRVA